MTFLLRFSPTCATVWNSNSSTLLSLSTESSVANGSFSQTFSWRAYSNGALLGCIFQSEDFSFAQFPQGLAFEPHGRNYRLLRFGLCGFSFDAVSTDSLWQKAPFAASGEAAVWDHAVVVSPSAPNGVAAVESSVFAAPEQFTVWVTCFRSGQNNTTYSKTSLFHTGRRSIICEQIWLR